MKVKLLRKFVMSPELINRPEYLDRLIQNRDADLVKIVTGVRRCGKSSLLDLFHQYLRGDGVDEAHIIHMNMKPPFCRELSDGSAFCHHVGERIPPTGRTYLIFDGIEALEHWEKAVEFFRLHFDVDICIASNSCLISTELSAQCVEIRMLPLSFKEFLTFHTFDPSTTFEEKFELYNQFGGMPALSKSWMNEVRRFQALEEIYAMVVLRDILDQNHDASLATLEKILCFLCSHIGNITSPNSIAAELSSEAGVEGGRVKSIAGKTVEKYTTMLCNAFLFYPVGRYDVKSKRFPRTLGKNYIVDLGLSHWISGYRDADRGCLIENIVFLELLRRGYRVSIGKVGETEVDFVAEKSNNRLYIQVTESMASPEAREHELRPLRMIRDNYEKIILSMEKDAILSYDGIKSLYLIDWLLS